MPLSPYEEIDPYKNLLGQYKNQYKAPATGGPLPPEPFVAPTMSGPSPPSPFNVPTTGGPLPPEVLVAPTMSGPTPPSVVNPPSMSTPLPPELAGIPLNGSDPLIPPVPPVPAPAVPQAQPKGGFAPAQVVTDTAGQILDNEGAYMRNARRRGIENAASRGLTNSSIAAGASQRAAIDAAAPLINNALNLQSQREQMAFQGEQSGLSRSHDFNMAKVKDWLGSQQFSREFNGALAMMPVQSAYQLNSLIQNYALDNPEVYTPQVINGMSNFFNQNFLQVLQSYFPAYSQGGTP